MSYRNPGLKFLQPVSSVCGMFLENQREPIYVKYSEHWAILDLRSDTTLGVCSVPGSTAQHHCKA